MTTRKVPNEKPYAGNPDIRFDEGEVASVATPRRGFLHYKDVVLATCILMAKYTRKINWPALVFCCAPLLIFLSVIFFLDLNPFHWVQSMNDEVAWYTQIDAVVKYGKPLGVFGYDETHAAIGSFGAWGGASIYAMALWGKIFGWYYYSPLFMNVSYMVLANLFFLLFARPNRQATFRLIFLNFSLFLSVHYMFTGMSECTRYSMAVVLSGVFCFLLNDENKNKRFYVAVLCVIAPVLLFFFANCYILFSVFFPVYGYILFRYLDPKKFRITAFTFLCAILPSFLALCCIWILNKTAAPFPSNNGLALQKYLNQLNICTIFNLLRDNIVKNYKYASIAFIFNNLNGYIDNACVSSYLFYYYLVIVVIGSKFVVLLKKTGQKHLLSVLVLYAMLTFVVAFFILYSTKLPWTFIRGLNVALVFSMYIVCMFNWRKLNLFLISIAFMQFFPFVAMSRDYIKTRYQPRNRYGGNYELFEKYASVFSSNMHISETENKWDNTYALFGTMYNFYCMMPSGFGWNYMIHPRSVSKPRYVITDHKVKVSLRGYLKKYQDDIISIFEKEPLKKETRK